MKTLIAEDDFTSRTMLAAVLKKNGYEVVETGDGAAAWEELQQATAPKLIILDWMMPVMDGLEVVRRVRALATDQPPYILMLTSKADKADIIAGLDAGANDYLSKPFDAGELRARIEVGRRMLEMQEALVESKEKLALQATHDPLTGMLNRRAVLDRLQEDLSRAGRHGESLSIGMCDLDHFKQINDTYGHLTGDEVLCKVSMILREGLRAYDTVGRYGGEEFLVITPMRAGTDNMSAFDKLRMRVAGTRITTRSGDLSVTMSIGVVRAAAGTAVDHILSAADAALYRAKDQGRNRVVYAGDEDGGGVSTCAS